MWEIDWQDPDRELVGEHRARKKEKKDKKEREMRLKKEQLKRASSSTKDSFASSATAPSSVCTEIITPKLESKPNTDHEPLTSFESMDVHPKPKSPEPRPTSTRPSGLWSPLNPLKRHTPAKAIDIVSHERTPSGTPTVLYYDGEDSPNFTLQESIFSTSPESDAPTVLTIVDGTPKERESPIFPALARNAASSEDPTSPIPLKQRGDMESLLQRGPLSASPKATNGLPPVALKSIDEDGNHEQASAEVDSSTARLVQFPSPPPVASNHNNPDSWRTPEDWAARETNPGTLTETESTLSLRRNNRDASLNFDSLQQDVKLMAASTPRAILARLSELWTPSVGASYDQADEIEMVRWMMSVLHHLDFVPGGPVAQAQTQAPSASQGQRLLVLYDSPDVTAYLSAFHAEKEIFHVSDVVIHGQWLPNVRVLPVQSSGPTFPQPPNPVDRVHSLSLQSLRTAAEIPKVLLNLKSCLRPGGVCQIPLIDPLPVIATMGKHMRAWLERHLLINLAKQRKCMSPSHMFPHWLKEAGLRGPGSSVTTARFYAAPDSIGFDYGMEASNVSEEDQRLRETQAYVRSLAGRTLWMEVWGPYVTASRWWWDDPACLDECLQLGTVWEYRLVNSVKAD